MIGVGIAVALLWMFYFPLVKAEGKADRRLEEIQRLTADRGGG